MPAQKPELSRRKRVYFSLVAACLGVLVSIFIGEVGLRIHEWRVETMEPTIPEELDLLQPNPNGTGSFRLRSNLDVMTRVGRYDISIKTNSRGMRWREVPVEITHRLKRVAFFGDSFTFGCWADSVENSLVGVFERSVSPERWEVLNFGVGGYGLADIELLLKEEGLRFSPSYVIVVIFNGNDFRDTFLGIDKDTIIGGVAVLDEENLAEKVPERHRQSDRTTSRPSEVTSLPKRMLHSFALGRYLAPFLNQENLAVEFGVNRRFIAYSFWSQYPYPDAALKARDESLKVITRINELLIQANVKLALVALPTSDQVHSRVESGPDYDIHFPQSHLRLFARQNNIPFLDLLPVFRTQVARTNERIYIKGDTHLNNAGHYLAGWHISEWFRCCVKNQPIGRSREETSGS